MSAAPKPMVPTDAVAANLRPVSCGRRFVKYLRNAIAKFETADEPIPKNLDCAVEQLVAAIADQSASRTSFRPPVRTSATICPAY